jgi:hypothetical protein
MVKKNLYLILSLIYLNCFSQDNEIGVFLGATNYIGDVGPTRYIDPGRFEGSRIKSLSNNYSLGVLYRKNFNNRISARIQFNYAKIGSNDNWPGSANYRKQRGKRFRNTISSEISLGLDFNFFKFDTKENFFQMTPYLHTGITFLSYNALYYPIGTNNAQKFANKSTFAVPITLGYKIKPLKSFIIAFEISAKQTFTENMDGSNPKFEGMNAQKAFGSDLSNDWYVFSGITLTYIFGFEPCYCPN